MKLQKFVAWIVSGMVGTMAVAQEPAPKAAAAGGPRIQVDRQVYDFGQTSLVQSVKGTFVISNAGDAPLELKKPTTSCGCTLAALKTEKLAPGEKTEMDFTLNVASVTKGRTEKHITVPSNDPQQPTLQLTVRAEIIPIYDCVPSHLNLGDIALGTKTNVAVQIKRNDGQPLDIARLEANSEHIQVKLEPVEGLPAAGVIQIAVTGDGAARRFNNAVQLFKEGTPTPVVAIPVSGRIVGDLVLSQEAVFWGIADPANWPTERNREAMTTRRIKITPNNPDTKLELTNLSTTIAELKVKVEPDADGKSLDLIAVLDKAPAESVRGTIKLDSNVKSQPVVEIPVTISVIKAAARN
jgi:hypothetical protein